MLSPEYFNATVLCKEHNKLFINYLRSYNTLMFFKSTLPTITSDVIVKENDYSTYTCARELGINSKLVIYTYIRGGSHHTYAHNSILNNITTWLRNLKLSPQNKSEYAVVSRLQNAIGGEREVITEAGKIDLMTYNEIIEVKNIKDWKSAIGQIISYGYFYPSRQKRIHLYGKTSESNLRIIKIICEENNITVTFE